MNKVSIWRWDRGEPVPDARLVVATPDSDAIPPSGIVVLPFTTTRPKVWLRVPKRIIPALFVQRQPDFAGERCDACGATGKGKQGLPHAACSGTGRIGGFPALMSMPAEHRGLVLSPAEAIDLRPVLTCPRCNGTGVVDSHNKGFV